MKMKMKWCGRTQNSKRGKMFSRVCPLARLLTRVQPLLPRHARVREVSGACAVEERVEIVDARAENRARPSARAPARRGVGRARHRRRRRARPLPGARTPFPRESARLALPPPAHTAPRARPTREPRFRPRRAPSATRARPAPSRAGPARPGSPPPGSRPSRASRPRPPPARPSSPRHPRALAAGAAERPRRARAPAVQAIIQERAKEKAKNNKERATSAGT